MARLGIATPPPEITTGKGTTLLHVVTHQLEDVAIVAVAPCSWTAWLEGHIVARIAELFHDEGLLQLLTDSKMLVDIVLGIFAGTRQILHQTVALCPSPVIRPEVYVTIVDVLVCTDTMVAVIVHFTAPCSLTTDRDEVVGVDTADECRSLTEPLFKGRQCLLGEGAWLVAYLP